MYNYCILYALYDTGSGVYPNIILNSIIPSEHNIKKNYRLVGNTTRYSAKT